MNMFRLIGLALAMLLALNTTEQAHAQCGRNQVQAQATSQDLLGQLLQSGLLSGSSNATSASSTASTAQPQLNAQQLAKIQALLNAQNEPSQTNTATASAASGGGNRLRVTNTGGASASASAVAGGNSNQLDVLELAALIDQQQRSSVSASSASSSNGSLACSGGDCGGGRFRPFANFGGRRQVTRATSTTRTFSR